MKKTNRICLISISIGLAAITGAASISKDALAVSAVASPIEVSAVSNQNIAGGWGLGIAVELTPVLSAGYWNAVASGGVTLVDKYQTPIATSIEEVGQQLSINRGQGCAYYGAILSFPAGWDFTVSTGSEYNLTSAKSFICKSADGVTGAYWDGFIAPTSLTLTDSSKTLEVGDTYAIPLELASDDPTAIVSYRSSDEAVATVSESGIVTAQGAGAATIAVYSGLLKQDLSLSVTATKVKTGITVTNDKKAIHVYQGNDWKLTPLTAVINYQDSSTSDLVITDDMISGVYDKDTVGSYPMTLAYGTFTDAFSIVVEQLPETTVAGNQPNGQFGTDDWTKLFFFVTTIADRGQYINLDAACIANANSHIRIKGNTGTLTGVKNLGGGRYVLYGSDASLHAGDKIELLAGLRIYQYSGTANGAQDPNGDGEFYAVGEFRSDLTYVYDGTMWRVWTADPTDFTLTAPDSFLSVGQALNLNIAVTPEGTYGTPTFASSDETIATVSSMGSVTGIAIGDAVITAKIGTVEHTIKLTVIAAKEIKSVVIEGAYNYYSVLKGSETADFKPVFTAAKYVFADDTTSPDFALKAGDYTVADFSTAAAGDQVVNVTIAKDGKRYLAPINVKVYEQFEQKVSEVAIVDWFIYSTFIEFKNTSTNIGNMTDGSLIPGFASNISYTRKDGTPVAIAGFYQLGTNIAVFPSFCYDDHENAVLTVDNYLQNYLVGDRIAITKNLPVYKWTGSVTGNNANMPIAGTGEVIVEGYVQETTSYRFNGQVWVLYIESTDIAVASPTVEVKIGKTILSGASRTPSNATSGTFSFASNDPSIAAVNEKTGAITGVAEGQATITVTLTNDDDGTKKTATIAVSVIDYITGLTFSGSINVVQNDSVDLSKASGLAFYKWASGKTTAIEDLSAATIIGVDTTRLGEQIGVVSLEKDGTKYTGQLTVEVVAPAGLPGIAIAGIVGGSAIVTGLAIWGIVALIKHLKA